MAWSKQSTWWNQYTYCPCWFQLQPWGKIKEPEFPYGLFFRKLDQEYNFIDLLRDEKKEEKALN